MKVDHATIPLAPKGCDPREGNAVRLRTSIAIEDSSQKVLEVNPELSWRCGRNELRPRNRRQFRRASVCVREPSMAIELIAGETAIWRNS